MGLEMVWELFKAVMSAALQHCRWIILLTEQQKKGKKKQNKTKNADISNRKRPTGGNNWIEYRWSKSSAFYRAEKTGPCNTWNVDVLPELFEGTLKERGVITLTILALVPGCGRWKTRAGIEKHTQHIYFVWLLMKRCHKRRNKLQRVE